jgi:hypothetical protein
MLGDDIETLRETAGVSTDTSVKPPNAVGAGPSSSSSIWISWSEVSGASYYRVYRSTSLYGYYGYVGSAYYTEYTDSGLSANMTYYYKVSVVDYYSTEGPLSFYASATTWSSSGGLNAPTNLSAVALSSSSIKISWSTVSNAYYYYVYRSTDPYYNYGLVGSTDIYSTEYTDYGLYAANTTYYYKVSSVDYYYTESPMSSSYASATTWSSSSIIDLTYNEMYNNYLDAGEIHYYRFWADSAGYNYWYVNWEDSDNSSHTADIKVGVRREDSSGYVVEVTDNSPMNEIEFYVPIAGYYIVEVHGYSYTSTGTYRIRYHR